MGQPCCAADSTLTIGTSCLTGLTCHQASTGNTCGAP
jgi:hypothetical protein